MLLSLFGALPSSGYAARLLTQRRPRARTATKKVLAVASHGGHWQQLLRLRPAFLGQDVVYVTTERSALEQAGDGYVVVEATRWSRRRLLLQALQVLWIILRERPDVVVSTGASVGFFALRIAKLCGARTIWIDSIANVEKLSMSGERIGRHADLWLTQWEHLASSSSHLEYCGAVL